jgi:glucokinase
VTKRRAPSLLADIGGTNARFARGRPGNIEAIRAVPCEEHETFEDALQSYLEHTSALADHDAPRQACLAVAGVVDHDRVSLTNHSWEFSIEATRERFGLDRLVVVNDFTALARAVPHLGPDELREVGPGEAEADAPIAVVGPGTGLGVAGMVRASGRWLALDGEGGHVGFAPANALEIEVLRHLMDRYGRVSAERILSGRGLEDLYTTLCVIEGQAHEPIRAAHITQRGTGSDGPERRALEFFCGALGSVAGDFALVYDARGGVYIGGGIVPRIADFFARSTFRERFESKGRFSEWIARIPTTLIMAATPGLTGAAAVLED